MYITMTDCTLYRLDTFYNMVKLQLHCSRMQHNRNFFFTKIQYFSFNIGYTKCTVCSRVYFFKDSVIYQCIWPLIEFCPLFQMVTQCQNIHPSNYISFQSYNWPSIHHPSIHPSIQSSNHLPIHEYIYPTIQPSTTNQSNKPSIRPCIILLILHPSIHTCLHHPSINFYTFTFACPGQSAHFDIKY